MDIDTEKFPPSTEIAVALAEDLFKQFDPVTVLATLPKFTLEMHSALISVAHDVHERLPRKDNHEEYDKSVECIQHLLNTWVLFAMYKDDTVDEQCCAGNVKSAVLWLTAPEGSSNEDQRPPAMDKFFELHEEKRKKEKIPEYYRFKDLAEMLCEGDEAPRTPEVDLSLCWTKWSIQERLLCMQNGKLARR